MGAVNIQAFFTIFLKLAKVLMQVITTVFSIFALLFVLAGNIHTKDWGSILCKLGDISLKCLEQTWWEKTEILAHVE